MPFLKPKKNTLKYCPRFPDVNLYRQKHEKWLIPYPVLYVVGNAATIWLSPSRHRIKKVSLKTCQHADHVGNRCRNSGVSAEVIYNALNHFLTEYEDRLRGEELTSEDEHDLKNLIASKENKIEQLKKRIR